MADSVYLGSVYATFDLKTDGFERGVSSAIGGTNSLKDTILGVFGGTLLTAAISKVTDAIAGAGTAALTSAAGLQQTARSFDVLIGNTETANKLFAQLFQYANTTPFEFPQIAKAGQTLLGFGVPAKDIMRIIGQIGDVASATGGDFDGLALVTGQVFAQGKLQANDFYQIINSRAGALGPLIAKNLGLNGVGALRAEFEKGNVTSKAFFDALSDATKQGGFAFNGVTVLAQSFNGRLSTLKDTALEFGRNLLGVKVDPQLGLTIQPGGLFDRASTFVLNLTNALSGLGPTMIAVGDAIGKGINVSIALLGQLFKAIQPDLMQLWQVIQTQVIPALGQLWQAIQPLLPILGVALVVALKLLIQGLILAYQAYAFWLNYITASINIFVSVSEGIGAFAYQTYAVVTSVFGAIYNFFAGIFSAIYNTIVGTIQTIYGIWGFTMGLFLAVVISIFRPMYDFIAGIFVGVYNAIVGPSQAAYSTTAGIFGAMYGFVVNIFSAVYNYIAGAINGAYNAVAGAVGGISRTIGGIYNTVVGAVAGAGSWLVNAGQNIIQGLINGILSMGGRLVGSLTNFIKANVPGPVLSVLGIHSPSRVFAEIGENTMLGFIGGVGNQANAVSGAVSDVFSSLPGASVSANMGVTASAATATQGANVNGGDVNIYGDLKFQNQSDIDYFIARISRNNELAQKRILPAS